MTAIAIDNLVVRRGSKAAVDGVSLDLVAGRITALLGPNGAGKSSLILALAGLVPLEAGTIKVAGTSIVGWSPEAIRKTGISTVLEGHRVLAGLSVDDNLRAAGFSHSVAALKTVSDEIYAIFPELAERRQQKAGSLSGGQQQMLSLGQALISRPKFLLADEMSLGLAPLIVTRLMGVVTRLATEGAGVLLIEQFTHVALKLATDVHVMSRGRLTYSGPPGPLIENAEILHKAYLS